MGFPYSLVSPEPFSAEVFLFAMKPPQNVPQRMRFLSTPYVDNRVDNRVAMTDALERLNGDRSVFERASRRVKPML